MNGPWRFAIVALFALLMTASAAADPPAPAPAAITKEALETRLKTLAATAKLTDETVVVFKDYSFACMKEELGKDMPDAFWTWLATQKVIREALIVEMHPKYDVNVLKRLEELRGKFGVKVDEYPHLATAFALVFGRAGSRSPWGPQGHYLRRDREAPSMTESFAYYLKYEKTMKFSLKKTPWPLLSYLADNETPIKERLWALKHYAGYNDSRLARIYNELRYDWGKLTGKARIGNRPRTLPNLKKYGGVCVERAYFASRVYKSMGIPAMSVSGEGQRGGHAWVAWIGGKGKGFGLNSEGRFFYDNYYVGTTWYPPTRQRALDREVELVAAAVGRSYDAYLDARIGCHFYEMIDVDDRKGRTQLLKDTVERNPFVAKPWRLLADARAAGIISQAEGERLFDTIFKALGDYPDLTFEVLAKVLLPRLEDSTDAPKDEVDRNLRVLNRAAQIYDKAKRPDLAMRLVLLKGSYLEAVGQKTDAFKLYVKASEVYAKEHYGFREVFDRSLRMMDGRKHLKRRLKFCEMMVKKVPKQRGDVDKKTKQFNPSYVYVVRAYVRALEAAGKEGLARRWEEKIATQ